MSEKEELSFEQYLERQLNVKNLTEEETITLISKANSGDRDAEEKLYRFHGKFVRKLARELCANTNVQFEDLYQEGLIGMSDAVKLYNAERDNKFMTFAYYHIYAKMTRYIADNNRNVRIPVHVGEILIKYNKMIKLIEIGALPEMSEIEQAHYINCSLSKLEDIKRAAMQEISIYNNSEDENTGLIDTFEASIKTEPEYVVTKECIKEQLLELIDNLTDKEALIIKLKFGLISGIELKDDDIANKLGVTKQAVNSLYQRGLKKMRNNCRQRNMKLDDFLY